MLGPHQNGRNYADYIFKLIFFYENVWIGIEISLDYFPVVQLTI